MINKYPGKCGCGARVEAGAGEARRNREGRFEVFCRACLETGSDVMTSAERASVRAYEGSDVAVQDAKVGSGEGYTLLSGHAASEHQAAVFDHFRYGRGSRIVVAVAGSGKTTTMKNALRYLPKSASVQMFAFNRKAARQLKAAVEELREKDGLAYAGVRAGTFHSVGLYAVRRYLNLAGDFKVEDAKCRNLLKERLCADAAGEEVYAAYGAFATKLVELAKGEGVGALVPDTEERWYAIVDHHGLYLETEALADGTPVTEADGVALARRLLGWSNEAARAGRIDNDDMLYLVCLWKLRLWRNDVVVCDECFVPDTPILVGLNGETKTITELYENGFGTPIVTWNAERGTHLSQITGVKRVPVGKPLVRVRTRQRGYAKNGARLGPLTEAVRYKTRTLVCTEDHKIWTVNGWVAAGKLTPGTVVKHETVAPIVRSYQSRYAHTAAGRKSLSDKADVARFGKRDEPSIKNRGGNGRQSPRERLLLERLGPDWISSYVVPTGIKRNMTLAGKPTGRSGGRPGAKFEQENGLPTHFKLDLANPEEMIAIEVDGGSHRNPKRRDQDARKETWLREHGWIVVRLTNEEVVSLSDDLLQERIAACPVEAEVVSVESWVNRKHEYVYDLEVEGTHCYFAHGLLVHNCQDTNPVRRAMLHLALKDGGRLYAVGDKNQSIYGFTGASTDAMDLIKAEFRAAEMPLTVSYRCARAVVERAQTWVTHIRASDFAPEGEVRDDVRLCDALATLGPEDAVLCRQTAPLVTLAYGLIARGRPCQVLGREIGRGLTSLIEKMKARGVPALVSKLEAFRDREAAKFVARGEEVKAEGVRDRVDCVLTLIDALPEGERTIPALLRHIGGMFVDDDEAHPVLTLCTVHKSKGLEWSKVAILQPELMPSRAARQEWQMAQEVNLQYVAATRAKEVLIYCKDGDATIDAPRGSAP